MTTKWLERICWLGTIQAFIMMMVLAADNSDQRSLQYDVLGFYDSDTTSNTFLINDRIRPVLKDRLEKERRPKKDISQLFVLGNKKRCSKKRDQFQIFDVYTHDDEECTSSRTNRGHADTRIRGKGKGKGEKSGKASKGSKGNHTHSKGKGGSKGSKSKASKASKGSPIETVMPTFLQTSTPSPTFINGSKKSKGSLPRETLGPTSPETIEPTVAPSLTNATETPTASPIVTSTPTSAPSIPQISVGPTTTAPSGNGTTLPSTTAPSTSDVTVPPSQNNGTTAVPSPSVTSNTVAPTRDPASPTSSPVSLPGVPASPFSVQYDITGTPTDADFTAATDLTQQYLNDYFTQQFGLNVATIMTDFTGAVTGTDPATATASYAVSVNFDDSSAFVPTTQDLDLMLIAAFQQPFVQTLLDSLAGLPADNPFSTATAANYMALNRRWMLI